MCTCMCSYTHTQSPSWYKPASPQAKALVQHGLFTHLSFTAVHKCMVWTWIPLGVPKYLHHPLPQNGHLISKGCHSPVSAFLPALPRASIENHWVGQNPAFTLLPRPRLLTQTSQKRKKKREKTTLHAADNSSNQATGPLIDGCSRGTPLVWLTPSPPAPPFSSSLPFSFFW